MEKFTGNYSNTEHNFVIQNIPESQLVSESELQIFSVLQNILLRGCPTILSEYLQNELELNEYYRDNDFNNSICLISNEKQEWVSTIGGNEENQDFPAKDFYDLIPELFPEYPFIQNLIQPETLITDIVETEKKDQRVDFYLEFAKLVIEIDGEQHKNNIENDNARDALFNYNNNKTIRIETTDIRNRTEVFTQKIEEIKNRINHFQDKINYYSKKEYSDLEIKTKLIPTAVLRWQILILTLLEKGALKIEDEVWNINILKYDFTGFFEKAIKDLFIWLLNLYKLQDKEFLEPKINITYNKLFQNNFINIDFSILKRWTDENIQNPNTIYVRTDYLQEKNYFTVSCSKPIIYQLKEENHREYLEFFLKNIFNKPNFRQGQLPIICNSLNRNDTIGLLPTGSGKSICYQLTAILQPGISFVVAPLKSLMIDQKENLDAEFVSNTNYISSDQTTDERKIVQKNFEQGKYLFIWISPERFQISTFRDVLRLINANYTIMYAVIDEVHCLSEWGHDFRISYLNLSKTISLLCPNAKFLGLTATASSRVHKDIKADFQIDAENIKTLVSFDREELTFRVIHCNSTDKLNNTRDLIDNFYNISNTDNKATLIFTPYVNGDFGCYGLYNQLVNNYNNLINYYSGTVPRVNNLAIMSDNEFDNYKRQVQKDFKSNNHKILVATKAFGMGIDKQNINLTIHYGIPQSIEGFYQEAGRAGRHPDKNKAKSACYILFSDENNNVINAINNPKTTIDDFNNLLLNQNRQDILRQLYFFTDSYTGIENEIQETIQFMTNFYRPNQTRNVHYNNKSEREKYEKCIYRLTLLNVIDDYTIDFNANEFQVHFNIISDDSFFNGLYNFVTKYELLTENELLQRVNLIHVNTLKARCLHYLIHWKYDNIAYERRQSLKGIADLCRNFQDPVSFKAKVVSYFEVTEITFILQHISENPLDFTKWFNVFRNRDGNNLLDGYMVNDRQAVESLKYKLQRFLESYKTNIGLNFISGFVRLCLNEFNDADGKIRFISSLNSVKEKFKESDIDLIINNLLEIGSLLSIEKKLIFSESVLEIFNNYSLLVYEKLGDDYSLNNLIKSKTKILKRINKVLYG